MKKLFGHGRILCSECGDIIISCKCMKCTENIQYDVCDKCAKKIGDSDGKRDPEICRTERTA